MKSLKKVFAVLAALTMMCATTLTVFADASFLNAGGLFYMYNSSGENVLGIDATCVYTGGSDYYVFTRPRIDSINSEGNTFAYDSVGSDKEYPLNLLFQDSLFSCFRLTEFTNVPYLSMGSWPASNALYVMYFDNSLKKMSYLNVTSVKEKEANVYVLDGVTDDVSVGAAIIDPASGNYIGMVLKNETGSYGISIEYINAALQKFNNPNSGNESGTTGTTGEATTGEGATATGETSESGSGVGKPVTILTILMVIVIGGLIVLVIFSKSKKGSNDIMPGDIAVPTPDGQGSPRLCISGEGGFLNGRRFEIDGSVIIGRQQERCNICYPIDAKGISSLHCQLRKVGRQIELIDLGSSYGTYVNGARLAPNTPVLLNPGDRFCLANTNNTFIVY